MERRTPARVICVGMQKGGVGKTTTVYGLARALSRLGKRVLVVDLDPQGNASDALSVDALPESSVSIADAMLPDGAISAADRISITDVTVKTIWPDVDLTPVTSSDALVRAELLIQASDAGREHRLREALEPVIYDYDAVVIDNAPSLGLLMANALAAGTDERMLVVMEADRWSTSGLVRLRAAIERAQRYTNPTLEWGGVLVSRWRGTRDERDKLADVAAHFPDAAVWATPEDTTRCIPLRVGIKTSVNEGIAFDESPDAAIRVVAETYEWAAGQLMAGRI